MWKQIHVVVALTSDSTWTTPTITETFIRSAYSKMSLDKTASGGFEKMETLSGRKFCTIHQRNFAIFSCFIRLCKLTRVAVQISNFLRFILSRHLYTTKLYSCNAKQSRINFHPKWSLTKAFHPTHSAKIVFPVGEECDQTFLMKQFGGTETELFAIPRFNRIWKEAKVFWLILRSLSLARAFFRCWQKAPRIDLHSNSHRWVVWQSKVQILFTERSCVRMIVVVVSCRLCLFSCNSTCQLRPQTHSERIFQQNLFIQGAALKRILKWNFNSLFELHNSKFQINIHCRKLSDSTQLEASESVYLHFPSKMHLRNFSTYFRV